MKKKPIKEGYKFFYLCNAYTGFCYVTYPNGLKDNTGGIWEQVVNFVQFLPSSKTKHYVAMMDSYFTCPKNIVKLAPQGVASVGIICNKTLP